MGTLRKVAGADYSANAVAKFDFTKNILRRKTGNQLERNYLTMGGGTTTVQGYDPVSIPDIVTVRMDGKYRKQSASQIMISIADYTKQRMMAITQSTISPYVQLQLWAIKGTETFHYNVNIITPLPAADVNYDIEYTIDFVNKKILNLYLNGNVIALPPVINGTNATVWTFGQTRTVCFGNFSTLTDDSSKSMFSTVGFVQLSSPNGIIKHYDFLGDTREEMLMDKATLNKLTAPATVTFVPDPILV